MNQSSISPDKSLNISHAPVESQQSVEGNLHIIDVDSAKATENMKDNILPSISYGTEFSVDSDLDMIRNQEKPTVDNVGGVVEVGGSVSSSKDLFSSSDPIPIPHENQIADSSYSYVVGIWATLQYLVLNHDSHSFTFLLHQASSSCIVIIEMRKAGE